MKLSELKQHLTTVENITFVQANGKIVPAHFHVTEIGLTTKSFIDCGGDVHTNKTATIQLWLAADFYHRLAPAKLLNIIDLSSKLLGDEDLTVEVEYEIETVGKYNLKFEDGKFVLVATQTDCLAKEKCGIPLAKEVIQLTQAIKESNCCTPGGGCC
jgi:hypothetical protein